MYKYILFVFWSVLFLFPFKNAGAWGSRGHELTVNAGNGLVKDIAFKNCHTTKAQIEEHVTDPDLKWKKDRKRHPDEDRAHYFHVDKQPKDWKNKKEPTNIEEGFLVYRIIQWMDKAKQQRKEEKWSELSETLYGLAHYVGDLTMPLHATSDHDGEEVGLPDLHKQWESVMIGRYEKDFKEMVALRLKKEKIPTTWKSQNFNSLIFTTAEQSYAKAEKLFNLCRPAYGMQNISPRGRKRKERREKAVSRFSKPKLKSYSGDLAADQLALASRLWANVLNNVCL